MTDKIKVVTFDADDTLWVNETYFQEMRFEAARLMQHYISPEEFQKELFKTEVQDLPFYGYGVKAFTMSMVGTVLRVSDYRVDQRIIQKIMVMGKEILSKPVELLDGIENILEQLRGRYILALATKGDLLDQRRKIDKSAVSHYFDHIEVMTEKHMEDYKRLIKIIGCSPDCFMMVGNSVKSDILPVLEMGGYAAHIPFAVTWEHEVVNEKVQHPRFISISKAADLLNYLAVK